VGEGGRAIAGCEQALTIAREIGELHSEAYALGELACAYAAFGDTTQALSTFGQALIMLDSVGDRWNAARCSWHYGLFLAQQGEYERAVALLRTCVDYEQQIEHSQVAEHAALLAKIEAAVELPAYLARVDEDTLTPGRNGVEH
jgi:tetratricopeptide (TPR) repeat protein